MSSWLQLEVVLVGAILLLFLGVGVWYSLAVPPFETPDELFHYGFARHLAAGNGLPVQESDVDAPWEQEGSQAPLYYLLVGWLTSPIDQSDFEAINTRNPRANIGDPLFAGNKNFMLYSAAQRPLVGSNLALHVGRWFSLCLGALTLLFTWLTARLALPDRPHLALIATLIVATIPQFVFISAALTNDNLINAASAATLYWLARLLDKSMREVGSEGRGARGAIRTTHHAPRNTQHALHLTHWLILGILLGIAGLSKLQGLGLFLLSGLVGLHIAWQQRDLRLPLCAILPVALPALAIAGWWYWRNYTLYGDWTGIGHLLENNGRRDDPLTLAGFWREFRGLRFSFWGLYGWFNILLPLWVYTLLDALTLLALAGLPIQIFLMRRRVPESEIAKHSVLRTPHCALLTLWSLLSLALLLYWTGQATGSQGRLLFPAIGALVILFVMGLDGWLHFLPWRGQLIAWALLPLLLIGCSLYTLTVLLPASYGAPTPVTTIPMTAMPVDVIYGNEEKIHLLALEIPSQRYRAGEVVPVTLYLQAPQKIKADYQLFIQLLDETRNEVGNLTSHPGWGRNPTSLWQPGAIYADRYPVQIGGPVDEWSPLLAQVYIGFIDPKTEESGRLPIPARNRAGQSIDPPFLTQVAISPRSPPQAPALTPAGIEFGNVIELSGVGFAPEVTLTASATLTVTLLWEAVGTPATDYTAFIHLRNAAGTTVAGFDRAPAAERFPTRHWRAGDQVLTRLGMSLLTDLPPGAYEVWCGLYDSASQGALRLPVTQPADQMVGDGEVRLGSLFIRHNAATLQPDRAHPPN